MYRMEVGRRASVSFLDSRRPTERAGSVVGVDLQKYREGGVTTLLIATDAITKRDGWKIDEKVIGAINGAGFENIVLVSRKKVKDKKTLVKLDSLAQQLDATVVVTAETDKETTAHPDILLKAAANLEAKPEQSLVIGSTVKTDIRSANSAGMHSILIRKSREYVTPPSPTESVSGGREQVTMLPQVKKTPIYSLNPLAEEAALPGWTQEVDQRLIAQSKIANIGPIKAAPVTVEGDLQLPFPGVRRKVRAHFYEHGRTEADWATKFRERVGFVTGALLFTKFRRTGRVLDAIAKISDAEGIVARLHKDGATVEGGIADPKADKTNSLSHESGGVLSGKLKARHLVIRTVADRAMKPVRDHYAALGVDVKARWPGKVATVITDAADNSLFSEKNPEWIQYAADAAKVLRVPAYIVIWEMEARKIKREQPLYEAAEAALLAQAA